MQSPNYQTREKLSRPSSSQKAVSIDQYKSQFLSEMSYSQDFSIRSEYIVQYIVSDDCAVLIVHANKDNRCDFGFGEGFDAGTLESFYGIRGQTSIGHENLGWSNIEYWGFKSAIINFSRSMDSHTEKP